MKNTIIYLLGFYGVGKYTIAREISIQADFRLVDNHLINNSLFSLVNPDGKTPLPKGIWDNVIRIWAAVLDTMKDFCPPDASFVLTNALFECDSRDHTHFANIESTANARNALFVPVRLICAVEENKKRIATPERAIRFKETSPESAERNASQEVLKPSHPNVLTLDVTNLSPAQAAEQILNHARSLG